MRHVCAIHRHAPHGRNDTDIGSTPLAQNAKPMLPLIGLRMLKRYDPLNARLGCQLLKLLNIDQDAAIQFEAGIRLFYMDIACHFKAQARFALQCNGSFSGVFTVPNNNGRTNPKTPLLQHKTGEHAPPNNGEHSQCPHNEPPKPRRVPTSRGHQRHV